MKDKQVHYKVLITAIIVIGALEALAITKGINGIVLTTVLVIIAGLAGYVTPSPIKLKGV